MVVTPRARVNAPARAEKYEERLTPASAGNITAG
jgi:hypothetical protein